MTNASFIDATARLVGNVQGTGDITLAGVIEGNVVVSGVVTILAGGRLVGDLQASEAEVQGTVEGDVQCAGAVRIANGAELRGSLRAGNLSLEPGARLSLRVETA